MDNYTQKLGTKKSELRQLDARRMSAWPLDTRCKQAQDHFKRVQKAFDKHVSEQKDLESKLADLQQQLHNRKQQVAEAAKAVEIAKQEVASLAVLASGDVQGISVAPPKSMDVTFTPRDASILKGLCKLLDPNAVSKEVG